MLRTFFSYRPRSGSRVLASLDRGVGICEVEAGTLAVGALGVLEIPAARPGLWFRRDAARFAEEVVSSVGGLAEDDRGVIRLAIPRRFLAAVGNAAVDLLGVYDPTLASQLRAQCWRQESGWISHIEEHGVALEFRTSGCVTPLRCRPGVKEKTVGYERVSRPALWFFGDSGEEIAVTDGGRPVRGWLDGVEYVASMEATEGRWTTLSEG